MEAKYKIILYEYESKKLKDGSYPIYLRVTKDGQRKYFSTELSAMPEDWIPEAERFNDEDKYQTKNHKLLKIRSKALKTIDDLKREVEEEDLGDYSLDDFERLYTVKKSKSLAKVAFEDHISDLKASGNYGNATAYERCLDMLQKHDEKFDKKLLRTINYNYVNDFDKWLIRRGCKPNTRRYYLKTLRALYNVKKVNDTLLEKNYPFGKDKFSFKKIKNPTDNRPLATMYLNKLKEARYVGTMEDARQLWLFSYYTRGMSFVDMAYLDRSNIQGKMDI